MGIPTTTAISFRDIQAEYGGVDPLALNTYYANAASGYTRDASSVPSTGSAISLSNLRGTAKPIVNRYNYYSGMTRATVAGTFNITQTGVDPNVQLQMNQLNVLSTITQLYRIERIQDLPSVDIQFEIYIATTATADSMWFFIGQPGLATGASTWTFIEGATGVSYQLIFQVYNQNGNVPVGVNLFRNGNASAVNYATTSHIAGAWIPVRLLYNKSTTNTFQVWFNGVNIINYSDPNHASWLLNSGNYWGFGCRTGGGTGDFYIRRLIVSPSPSLGTSTHTLDAITAGAKSACTGAYSLRRLTSSYTGPTVTIRRGSDNATANFYSNASGALGMELNGTGTSLATWLNNSTAYVTQLYDQSGQGNHVVAPTVAAQPTLTGGNRIVFSGAQYFERAYTANMNTSNYSMILGMICTNTGLNNYMSPITSRSGTTTNLCGYAFYRNPSNVMEILHGSNANAWGNVVASVPFVNNVLYRTSMQQNGSSTTLWCNGVTATGTTTVVPNTTRPLRIGVGGTEGDTPVYFWYGSITDVMYFNTSISDADRNILLASMA